MRPGYVHPETPWEWVTANLGDNCKYLKDTVSCRKAREADWLPLFESFKRPPPAKRAFLSPSKFRVQYPLQLLSTFREQSPEASDENESYYSFELSKIAFNAPKTKAMFFGSSMCGGLCGRGELIILEKVDKDWKIIDTFRFWIA